MSPVGLSEYLQSPDPPFPVPSDRNVFRGPWSRPPARLRLHMLPLWHPRRPFHRSSDFESGHQVPVARHQEKHLRVAFEAVPLSGKVTSRRPSHQLGTRSCEAPSEALPGERQEFQEPGAEYLAEGVKSHVPCHRPGPVQQ